MKSLISLCSNLSPQSTLLLRNGIKVHLDYHVQIDYNKYSAPHVLDGEYLTARITSTTVELFNGEKRVASHMRQITGKNRYSTHMKHMPEKHVKHLKMTPEKIMNWADRIGPHASQMADAILKRREHPAQGYRAILDIMTLSRKYGAERLEKACGMALRINSLRLRDVKLILQKELDLSLFDGVEKEDEPIMHKNIRGKEFYGGKEPEHC